MAINLLDMLKEQMTDAVMGQAASVIGENSSATSSAMSAILPTILGSVISKGSTSSGAGRLLNMIADGNHDGSVFDNLGSLLGGGDATSGFMKSGGSLLSGLLGNNLGTVVDLVTSATGLRRNSSSSLMNMVAPMVMGMIGRYVRKNGLNAGGLMDMLLGQKKHVASALPTGMGSLLGFGANTGSSSTSTNTSHQTANNSSDGGGGGWMKWAIGALVLAGLAYFGNSLMSGAKDVAGAAGDAAGQVVDGAGDMAGAAADAVKGAMSFTKDAAGNIVDASGNVLHKAGEFTMDAAGNVVDASGNVLTAAAGAAGDAAGAAADAVKGAVSWTKDAAGNIVDAYGNVLHKAGDFTMAAAGNVVDASGNVLSAAAGAASDAAGAATGAVKGAAGAAAGAASAAAGAVKGAAGDATGAMSTKTMTTKFTNMFKQADEARKTLGSKVGDAAKKVTGKAKGDAGTAVSGTIKYALTDIVFKDGSQRIETFTKGEVEGLAAALKSYPKAKISVQATGDNKALAGQRATAVHDMLVALGVSKKQLSSKGIKGDATKVNIVVQ